MSDSAQPNVAVIGAGPAGLMAAEVLARGGAAVTVYERMPSAGRKFLLAGRGGLNLTHSEELDRVLTRYGAARGRLRVAIKSFPPAAVRDWSESLGQSTFIGTSGRVFPTAFKASPLLRAWLRRLDGLGVRLALRHHWRGWNDSGELVFDSPTGSVEIAADATVLALGGASWPRLGSDGDWVAPLTEAGVAVAPLRPANCAFTVAWSELFRSRFAGQPLKRIAIMHGDETVRGEAVITEAGIEGTAIYELSGRLRDAITATGETTVFIALRADTSQAELQQRLTAPRGKQSLANFLRKALRLSPVAIGLLHEAAIESGQRLSDMTPDVLAQLINGVPLRLTSVAPIARAISTAGGVVFDAIDDNYMLHDRPGTFVAGEMLDWEAPTGGYLLQAAFATGAAAGRGTLAWLDRAPADS